MSTEQLRADIERAIRAAIELGQEFDKHSAQVKTDFIQRTVRRLMDSPGMATQRRIGFDDGYAAAVANLRWLADARDYYDLPDVKEHTDVVRHAADMVEKSPDEAWGWLPSHLWDEWSQRRLSDLNGGAR